MGRYTFLRTDRPTPRGVVAECSLLDADMPFGDRTVLSSFLTGLTPDRADALEHFLAALGVPVVRRCEPPDPPPPRRAAPPPHRPAVPPGNSPGLFPVADDT